MIFNSFQFIWLFPLIFIIYWTCHRLNRPHFSLSKYVLLAISYGVYLQWNVFFGGVLVFVTLTTYLTALAIGRYGQHRKPIIWTGTVLTLSPLLFFKYFNFLSQSGASALQWIGIDVASPEISWVVPLGLSFYTFQALGYILDVYRNKFDAEKNIVNYALFVAFFPQILCGPISRAESLLPQLRTPRAFSFAQGVSGLKLILWGVFLKVVVADRLGLYVDTIYSDYASFSGTSSILAALFFSIQIYGDFAGYSYIAVGVARLLGIDIIVNFRRPYFAQSVSEFWRHWHISLTKWLTDYIYIPLGGSRCGKLRTYFNLMVTFGVSGIWHGANFTFIFWGILNGLYLVIEKILGLNKQKSEGFVRFLRIVFTFLIITLAWVYFRAPSISVANSLIAHMSSLGKPYIDTFVLSSAALGVLILIIVESVMEFKPKYYSWFSDGSGAIRILRWAVYLNLLAIILLFGVLDASQFIYVVF